MVILFAVVTKQVTCFMLSSTRCDELFLTYQLFLQVELSLGFGIFTGACECSVQRMPQTLQLVLKLIRSS